MNKNLNYINESFKIYFKRLKEYKANVIMAFILSLSYNISYAIFLFILYISFNSIINWSYEEYFFFLFFTALCKISVGEFWAGMNLPNSLLQGKLNPFLTKPINTFLQYTLSTINFNALPNTLIYIGILGIFFLHNFYLIDFSRLLILILFTPIVFIFQIAFFRSIDSLAFFMKNQKFIYDMVYQPYRLFDNYPATMFEGNIAKFSLLFPNVFYGAYGTLFLFGHISYLNLLNLLFIVIAFIVLYSSIIYFLWKFGLKKYETFG